ncbi:MAG: L-aspartate oxidase [Deltaproteobacteria bacterium]|nr:L-aspartate oxidase [Deltaproteobacteria bacterium]
MRAALAAREEGAEVALASKTPIGKSTCTQLSGGAFSVTSQGFSLENHYELSFLTGKELNQKEFLRILGEETPQRIRELEGFGLQGEWRTRGYTTHGKAPVWGNPIVEVLKETAQHRGILLHPWVMIVDLIQDGGKMIGALGFNFRTGKQIGFSARAIVLANGGGGALYSKNDNPVRNTGDGYSLAYKAGCALRDMEFVQFIPIGLAEPGKPANLLAPSLADAGKVLNSEGEDIFRKYRIFEKPVAVRCRDTFARAIAFEEREGKGVFLDLSLLTESTWPGDHMALSQREMLTRIYSCKEKPLRISPTCHFFMGGIATTKDGETGVPGLFAAGEVVGGVHGANRMGGNALSEIFVFGYRAGKSAGQWAQNTPPSQYACKRVEQYAGETGEKFRYRPTGTPPRELRRRLGKILWEKVGILRDKMSLSLFLKATEQMEREEVPLGEYLSEEREGQDESRIATLDLEDPKRWKGKYQNGCDQGNSPPFG